MCGVSTLSAVYGLLCPCQHCPLLRLPQARSDALECLFDTASGNVSVLDGWITKDNENTVDPDQVGSGRRGKAS